MIRTRLSALAVTLLLLGSTLQTACVRTVEVPVAVPRPPCPLPTVSDAPSLSPGSLGDLVTLTTNEAVQLGEYLRDEARWHEMAAACLSGDHK